MNLWSIASLEWVRMSRIRSVMIINFLLPVALIFILGSSLAESGLFGTQKLNVNKVKIGVVMEDNGAIRQAFEAFLSTEHMKENTVITSYSKREAAIADIKDGKLNYAVRMPAQFSEQVMQGKKASLEWIRGSKYATNMRAEALFESFVSELQVRQASAIFAKQHQAPQVMAALQQDNSSSRMGGVVVNGKLNTDRNVSAMQYYSASMIVMFVLYAGMQLALSISMDYGQRTLQRMITAPNSIYVVLVGKVLGQLLLVAMQAAFIMVATTLLFGVDWGSSWFISFVICLLVAMISLGIGLIVCIFMKSEKAIQGLFQFIIATMMALSGGFIPIPKLQDAIGAFLVPDWAMQGILESMMGATFQDITTPLLVLGTLAFALLTAALIGGRKVVSR
ncbi:ABC transporter permease [Paenibacillus sp. 481]|uniref:ABC transporter permease n=1 Tax=Paenibacillus sp. 481 TaxID=2835869 RepID=UPI001E567738|nr:ABC transporter permease [Paenibacillus sp. 481]UHA74850.1 ABC transporter permease [Paenibacillus sp. 481]